MIYLLLAVVIIAFGFLTWLAQMAIPNPYPTRMETGLAFGLAGCAALVVLLFVLYAKAV